MTPAKRVAIPTIALLLTWSAGCRVAPDMPAPNGATLTGIGHGDTVTSPFPVGMEAEGIAIAAAGTARPGEGHFHILVDVPCVAGGTVIPEGDGYHHFEDGASRAELDLSPGEHWLCLQVGDGANTALTPPGAGPAAHHTHEIRITVED